MHTRVPPVCRIGPRAEVVRGVRILVFGEHAGVAEWSDFAVNIRSPRREGESDLRAGGGGTDLTVGMEKPPVIRDANDEPALDEAGLFVLEPARIQPPPWPGR